MRPTHSGVLPLSPLLSDKAQSAFVLDDLRTGTLISLSQLCDDDCVAIFSRFDVKLVKDNQVLLTGHRLPSGLWSLPLLAPPSPHQANGILRLDRPKTELAQYYYAALGSPAPSVSPSGSLPPGYLSTDHVTTSRLSSFHYFAH